MSKNRNLLLGGIAGVLGGIGIARFIGSQNGKGATDEVWSVADMPDLTGKVIVVTGANSGIGYEAAREFARKGAHTVMACRSMDKAQAAQAQIQAEIPTASVEVMPLDLTSLASVRQFAADFMARYDRLDVLVNNAGIMMVPYGVTEDGFERQFGTNHLGHFALTGLLIDVLLKTPGARVVNVSSNGHRFGKMDFTDMQYQNGNPYSPQGAYGRSKLANLIFTYELQRRFDAAGVDLQALAAHPGGSNTNLGNHLMNDGFMRLAQPLMERMIQSAAMGALPTIRAAVDPSAQGAEYYGPKGFMELGGYPVVVQSNAASHDESDAMQLWEMSEELTGVSFAALNGNQ